MINYFTGHRYPGKRDHGNIWFIPY